LSSTNIPEIKDERDQKTFYFHVTFIRRVITFILTVIFSLISKIQIETIENLPSDGPVVLAANHLTNYDVFPLQISLPRPIFYMGKSELYQNRLLDWLLRKLGTFPVYRGEKDVWAIRHAEKLLENGHIVGIFPEGSRNKGRGLKPAKTGAARLSQAMKCPIVPVGIHGTQYMLRNFPKRTIVIIKVGEPIYPEAKETHLNLTDRMMFSLAELLPPESQGVYRYRPPGF